MNQEPVVNRKVCAHCISTLMCTCMCLLLCIGTCVYPCTWLSVCSPVHVVGHVWSGRSLGEWMVNSVPHNDPHIRSSRFISPWGMGLSWYLIPSDLDGMSLRHPAGPWHWFLWADVDSRVSWVLRWLPGESVVRTSEWHHPWLMAVQETRP